MGIPRPISFLGRVILDVTIVTSIIIFVPGLPPDMKFQSYSLTPVMELEGKLAVNSKLDSAVAILDGKITGPESIAIRGDELFAGLIGGNVIRAKDGKVSVVAKFGKHCEGKWQEKICGRPLGMRFDGNGKLVVVDAYYGLFRVDVDTGNVETLVSSNDTIDGKLPMNPNDLDIAKDGTIYWTDSSTNAHLEDAIVEFLGEPSGRLIKYDPKTKKSVVMLKDLHFANGVQLSKNEDFLLISESCRNRVLRYTLKGDKRGHLETLLDGLPGTPDNIRPTTYGGFYVSLIVPRYSKFPGILDIFGPLPLARKFALRVMMLIKTFLYGIESVFPNEYVSKAQYYIGHFEPVVVILPKHSIILELDINGKLVQSLHATNGEVAHISQITVDNKGEFAYLGSPYNTQIWKLNMKDLKWIPKIPELTISE